MHNTQGIIQQASFDISYANVFFKAKSERFIIAVLSLRDRRVINTNSYSQLRLQHKTSYFI